MSTLHYGGNFESCATIVARLTTGIFRKTFCLILTLFAFSGHGTTITFERLIDLSTVSLGHLAGSDYDVLNNIYTDSTVTVRNGDIVDYRYTFTNGRLRMSDL